jgi:hypothetical protein
MDFVMADIFSKKLLCVFNRSSLLQFNSYFYGMLMNQQQRDESPELLDVVCGMFGWVLIIWF